MTTKINNKAKKKSPYFLFFLFFVILFIWVLVPRSQRNHVISVPQNKGFTELYSIDETLVALESGGTFYLFDWSNVDADAVTFPAISDKAVLFNRPTQMSLSVSPAGEVVVMDQMRTSKFRKSLGVDAENILIVTNGNRSKVMLMAVVRGKEVSTVELYKVNVLEQRFFRFSIVEIDVDCHIKAAVVSEQVDELIIAGKQNGEAFMSSIDLESQKVKWKKKLQSLTSIFSLALSNQFLFVGSEDGSVSKMDPDTGEELKRLTLVAEPRKNTNFRRIYKTVLSPNDKWLACSCDPEVFLLNPVTLEMVKKYTVSHKIVAGVTFSPDETKLATSDLRADGKIEIHSIENTLNP